MGFNHSLSNQPPIPHCWISVKIILINYNFKMRMSEISKHILIKPPWARTDQELLHVQIVLRSIKDYANYPVDIQKKIAEVGEYVKYESRRIIVREGHPAWNFYIILSGSGMV